MYEYENKLYQLNLMHICGVDEAGRGPLAGPVFAAAVILKPGHKFSYVRDSKQLSEKQRLLALEEIKAHALSISIAIGSVEDIDRINIYRATRETMISAIEGLKIKPDFILTDAMPLNHYKHSESIIKGDQKSISIAAASIVAKTARDLYMVDMSKLFPKYGFENHKGYGTKEHLQALSLYGVTPIHRKSFEPIKSMLLKNIEAKM
jgi:ribonuclease HII